ncbi:hypothetical protein HanIR_Chr01g0010491 [Helianthus annuus]|nr:hypothetical protein HanIR_Chr03g0140141 [Helianthus annuus]KAJ0621596.1 hypothetical protein HanIR_Chr01g0010491 [Helianthus annuus]
MGAGPAPASPGAAPPHRPLPRPVFSVAPRTPKPGHRSLSFSFLSPLSLKNQINDIF